MVRTIMEDRIRVTIARDSMSMMTNRTSSLLALVAAIVGVRAERHFKTVSRA